MFLTLLLITVAYIIIIWLEVPRLVVQRKWRDLAAFFCLLLPAMVYSYGITLDLKLPNPTDLIVTVFEPLALRLEQILAPPNR